MEPPHLLPKVGDQKQFHHDLFFGFGKKYFPTWLVQAAPSPRPSAACSRRSCPGVSWLSAPGIRSQVWSKKCETDGPHFGWLHSWKTITPMKSLIVWTIENYGIRLHEYDYVMQLLKLFFSPYCTAIHWHPRCRWLPGTHIHTKHTGTNIIVSTKPLNDGEN